jgi:uncharacterized protein YecE (DUF72 family)
MAGRIVVGTSSWADPGFVEDWYPEGLPARDRLPWYAQRFEAVEVNSTHYALPQRETVERWAEVTPPAFTFHVKLHRLLSRHAAQPESLPPDLRDQAITNARGRVNLTAELEAEMVDRTLEAVEPLADAGKLDAFLLQLTPAFSPIQHKLEELEPLLSRLAPHPVAVELRHRGWVDRKRIDRTLGFLEDQAAAFVCVDAPPGDHVPIMPPIDAVTRSDLAYMRMHGRNTEGYMRGRTVAERFGWVYSDDELEEVRGRAEALAERASNVQALFNNNARDDAPKAARRLRELLGQDPGPGVEEPQLSLGKSG